MITKMMTILTAALVAVPLPAAGGPSASPAKAKPEPVVLWDHWYTITVNKNVKYAYYHERVEAIGDRVRFLAKTWKKTEGFLNEESFGGFATNTPELKPLFYNLRSTYRSTETKIDGTLSDGKKMTVRAFKGDTELPITKRFLPEGTIFSVFFPLWVGKNLAELRKGKPVTFKAVFEDNLETGFRVQSGRVRMAEPDAFAKKTGTHRIAIKIGGIAQTYWVRDNGAVVRVVSPKLQMIQKLVTREKAEKFFD